MSNRCTRSHAHCSRRRSSTERRSSRSSPPRRVSTPPSFARRDRRSLRPCFPRGTLPPREASPEGCSPNPRSAVDLAAFLAGRLRPAVMGILNVTPDSFSDGGLYFTAEAAVEHGLRLAREGADWLDVGGESTRPPVYGSAQVVPAAEEIRRTAPVVEALARELTIPTVSYTHLRAHETRH